MPDILLVGFDDVSAAECGPGVCPNLATFRATAFETQAFSHPVCSQSRAAILFGSYGKKIGTWKDIGALEPTTTTPLLSLPTMPGALQAAGYQTALVGKWHCGPHTEGAHWALAPLERGYESWLAGTRLNLNSSPSQDYRDWQRADADVLGFLVTEHESRYATLAQLEEAQAWWTITPGPKRFLHVALNAPHGPLHSDMPDELLAGWPRPDPLASNRTKYLAMLRTADTAFGRLLDMVGPETAVFLYSDNGTSKQSAAASVNPDHTKETTFDPGVRVLTLGRWGNCPVGFFSVLTHLVDIGAGMLAVAGVMPPTSWDSKTMGRTYVLSEAELSDGIVDRAARTQTHKLRQVTSESGVLEELYDLVVDPLEEVPLDLEAAENQAALLYLRAKLDAAAL
jgi:arylsulfatase A-like enzyme